MSARAWLEIGRVSNLPTCVSNVAVGFVLGGGTAARAPEVAAALVAVVSFYEAGMVLNDLVDEEEDRRERPGRPIPSGRVSRRQAAFVFGGLFALGWACVLLGVPEASPVAAALTALILAYNLLHGRFAGAPLLMGACRACVYLLGAAAASGGLPGPEVILLAVALGVYVASVSCVARGENAQALSPGQKAALVAAGASLLAPVLIAPPLLAAWLALAVALAWFGWTAFGLLAGGLSTGAAVGRLLAGMSLFDGVALARTAAAPAISLAWACFAGTVLAHRRVRGT